MMSNSYENTIKAAEIDVLLQAKKKKWCPNECQTTFILVVWELGGNSLGTLSNYGNNPTISADVHHQNQQQRLISTTYTNLTDTNQEESWLKLQLSTHKLDFATYSFCE